MKTSISISACNRPDYLIRVLGSIFANPGPIPPIVVSIDKHKDNGAVIEVCEAFPVQFSASEQKLGCNGNVRRAINMGFATGSGFNIHIEDDICITPDALEYITWASEKYAFDNDVRTVTLWGPGGEPFAVGREIFFTCWGWGTWKNRWAWFEQNWTTGDDGHQTSWDVVLSSHWGSKKQIFPFLSRAYNIGEQNGTHRGREWPGQTSAGIVDPDGEMPYREIK